MSATTAQPPITRRWSELRHHAVQHALWDATDPNNPDRVRFPVVPAGRRSGKTELMKRRFVLSAMTFTGASDGWFVLGAPTHQQAKRLFWNDVKALSSPWMMSGRPSESELTIRYINGCELSVIGLDAPERIEGRALDAIGLDEFGNVKPDAWPEHIRPALSTPGRIGWAWFSGVPEGRNHYYDIWIQATEGEDKDWAGFTWPSADILDPHEIEAAKRQLDARTYQQEYEASFVDFSGRAYWAFQRECHSVQGLASLYDPEQPLIVTLDYNVAPGVAAIGQEMSYAPGTPLWSFLDGRNDIGPRVTAWIGSVYIPHDSNTPAVCRKIAEDWRGHAGDVIVDGDYTGGARRTSQTEGSDWALVRDYLRPTFGSRLKIRTVPNPLEKERVGSVNARLRTADGLIHMLVDGKAAPEIVRDLEGVQIKPGSAGEIWKKPDDPLTHISDALGYYVNRVHGIKRTYETSGAL